MFDASCTSRKRGSSPNDILHAETPFNISLFDVMCKFRPYSYAIVSSIEKVFLQISLVEKRRDYTRFILFKNINKIDQENLAINKFIKLRYFHVLFGITSSPFLLYATVRSHVLNDKYVQPDIAQTLSSYLTLLRTDYVKLHVNAKNILKGGSFHLCKFKSNNAELENQIYSKYPEDKEREQKVLSINWNETTENFIFDLKEMRHKFE